MDKTSKLQLPYLLASQAQKHITHNDALRSLDAIVQLSVVSQNKTDPPSSPTEGDRYIVETNATNEWLGKDLEVAAWQDGSWMFYTPQEGWLCWVEDENTLLIWDGNGWASVGGGTASVNPAALVGVNATADTTNRLSVNSPATLFNHEGDGHQLKVNKNTDTDTASLLFQTGFSGRAEMGLTGDDDFHLKVSGDGSNWTDVMQVRDGFLTTPNRPSFRASPSEGQIFNGSFEKINFNNTHHNIGNHYDFINSQFISSVSGVYIFTASVRFDAMDEGSYLRLYLQKNNSSEGFQLGHVISGNTHSTNYESLSLTSILQLNSGDQISLHGGRNEGGGRVQIESTWSGALLF